MQLIPLFCCSGVGVQSLQYRSGPRSLINPRYGWKWRPSPHEPTIGRERPALLAIFSHPSTMLWIIAFEAVKGVAQSLDGLYSNITYYPPINGSTATSNLTWALDGSGAPGIYNSSVTPNGSYGIYNWCDMPHVRAQNYPRPAQNMTLQYVEMIQRHQKRTPYASNQFPHPTPWYCNNSDIYAYLSSNMTQPAVPVAWNDYQDEYNPFSVEPLGTCEYPQITPAGFQDSYGHGQDVAGVYRTLLGFLPPTLNGSVKYRVTSNVITSQVAGGLVRGMFPTASQVYVMHEIDSIDSLEPTYTCPWGAKLHKNMTSVSNPSWAQHLNNSQSTALYARLDSVSGVPTNDHGGFHVSFDHYYDNLSARLCHQMPLPCNGTNCVTQADADMVFRLGQYEYSYYYRSSRAAFLYSLAIYGAYINELKNHLRNQVQGQGGDVKFLYNVAHDGSVGPLLGALQISELPWPGMGSEVVFELWKGADASHAVRVLWGGQPLNTTTPMGVLDMVPVDTFLNYLDNLTGPGSSGRQVYNMCYQ